MKKIFTLIAAVMLCGTNAMAQEQPTPVYFNDFETTDGLTIVGAGSIVEDNTKGYGKVFQNVTSTAPRQNYLLLPDNVLSHSATTQQMTIGFWVNAANAGESVAYLWAPMFMAYGAAPANGTNTWPMLACQYRGVIQVNCAGWCDFVDAQNKAGVNTLYHGDTDWLADHKWHYYTVVFDGEDAKVFFDGILKNEWDATVSYTIDGNTITGTTQKGLFSNGADLKYICLGGNQAWNWPDNDPGFAFDDFAIYDKALTKDQIGAIITAKGTTTAIQTVKAANSAAASVRYNLAGQQVDAAYKGVVIENGKKMLVK